MEAKEKQPLDFPEPMNFVWRKMILRWAFELILIALIYLLGIALHIWGKISPIGLIASWIMMALLIAAYKKVMSPLLLKPLNEGLRYLQSEDYDRALEAFKQFYAVYDQHPHRERLHMLLLLDAGMYGYREIALLNQAHAHIQSEKFSEAARCYEQCLTFHPDSPAAISSLNFIAALTGGEIRPEPDAKPFWQYARGKHPASRWQGCLSYLIFLFWLFCCSVLIFLVLRQLDPAWRFDTSLEEWIVGLIAVVSVSVLLRLSKWAVARLILMDFHRGERLYRKRQYRECIAAFQEQVIFLQENPWIDRWRWLILPKSGPYSYQEWALLNIADSYVQLGEGERLLPVMEQVADLNPRNGMAVRMIKFINLFRGEDGSG